MLLLASPRRTPILARSFDYPKEGASGLEMREVLATTRWLLGQASQIPASTGASFVLHTKTICCPVKVSAVLESRSWEKLRMKDCICGTGGVGLGASTGGGVRPGYLSRLQRSCGQEPAGIGRESM